MNVNQTISHKIFHSITFIDLFTKRVSTHKVRTFLAIMAVQPVKLTSSLPSKYELINVCPTSQPLTVQQFAILVYFKAQWFGAVVGVLGESGEERGSKSIHLIYFHTTIIDVFSCTIVKIQIRYTLLLTASYIITKQQQCK